MSNSAMPHRMLLNNSHPRSRLADALQILRDEPLESSAFAASVALGLQQHPRRLECRFLYDSAGSRLFEEICRQPEYYLTRTETGILTARADEICRLTGPVTMLELGSGCSMKTGHLLAAHSRLHGPLDYLPNDVSATALGQACRTIGSRYPAVRITGIHGTYEKGFSLLGRISPALLLFLGSTIGNFDDQELSCFWRAAAQAMTRGDFFLAGADLIKDEKLLTAAYNDAAGVTAAFTRNLFARMNRELDAGLDLDGIEHVARYHWQRERMEIYARFTRPQNLRVRQLDRTFEVKPGEEILVEISRKFRLSELEASCRSHGFKVVRTFTDPQQWFGLLLLQRA